MRHAAFEHAAKPLRRQTPFRRRARLLQKASGHFNRNELSCRAGRHIRLRNRNLAEPLQEMIPELPRELPSPIAQGASLCPFLHFSLSRFLLPFLALCLCTSVANPSRLQFAANHASTTPQTENC